MKIFDCFLYSGELEILKLRVELMAPYVDKFLIIEANQTFSGLSKPMFYLKHSDYLKKYSAKIDYKPITNLPEFKTAWEREHYLRDQIRLLVNASEEDIIIVADVDEIVNIPHIKQNFPLQKPAIIELTTYYNFLNLKSNEICGVTLITPYKFIKNRFIGNRNYYKDFATDIIKDENGSNGGHFTYQFGYDLSKYIEKIENFSHQEFNTPYFLNQKRIKKCLDYNLDVLERWRYTYRVVNLKKTFPELYALVCKDKEYQELFKFYTFRNILLLSIRFLDPFYVKRKKYPIMVFFSKIKRFFFFTKAY